MEKKQFSKFYIMILMIFSASLIAEISTQVYPNNRPEPSQRKFNSTIIDELITNISAEIKSPLLAAIFQNCFPNTLDTTVNYSLNYNNSGLSDTFVITGDIDAMWNRDSYNQVFPYVQFANQSEHLKDMIFGVINRQIFNILQDPYANAFNMYPTGNPGNSDITTKIVDGQIVNAMDNQYLWERKYESDSISAVLRLATYFYSQTKDSSFLNNPNFTSALQNMLDVFEIQLLGTNEEDLIGFPAYTFERFTNVPTDTLIHGRGNICKNTGMVKQAFRPSDDACTYNFNIPGNAFIVVVLNDIANLLMQNDIHQELAKNCLNLSESIRNAIYKYGVLTDPQTGEQYFAYEVDGYGNSYFMDDANVPSLLSLPYLNFVDIDDPLYQNTRKRVLSNETNPYYYVGTWASGVGSPHTGMDGYIWPLAITMQALTSNNDQEIISCLQTLITTTNSTYFMHESFYMDEPANFTRSWFAWANTLFGELIVKVWQERPHILAYDFIEQGPVPQQPLNNENFIIKHKKHFKKHLINELKDQKQLFLNNHHKFKFSSSHMTKKQTKKHYKYRKHEQQSYKE